MERPCNIPLYARRSPVQEWRANLFTIAHGSDFGRLTLARDAAFAAKLRTIARRGRRTGHKAGYDPAGVGSPWYSVGPRNVNGRVKSLAVHPTNPDIVYVGAASGGLWKTIDGGQTWNALWDTQESLAIGAVALAPSQPQTVYVGTGEWTPGWGASYGGVGLYVSTDGGATWSKRPAVSSRRIGKILVHPTDPQRLWACGDRGLEGSTDGGLTWTTLNSRIVTDMVLDPLNPSTMFTAVRNDGFYKSVDFGSTFTLLAGSPTGTAVSGFPKIAVGTSGTHRNDFLVIKMDADVQTSIDGGNTFTATSETPRSAVFTGWADVIAVAPDDERVLIWGCASLAVSTDGGASWTAKSVHADQQAAVFAPSNANIVYFANDGGVWKSVDKGATISKISNGLVITQFYNINFWRPYSNVLGGGAQDNGVILTTGSESWNPIFGGDGGWVVIDPGDPRIIYTESQYANLVKSVDGGKTWVAIQSGIDGPKPWEGVLVMDPNDHRRLFYGTDRVLRTTDGAATAWTTVSQTLVGSVTAIAVDPANSSRVFVGTTAGRVYRSDDGGDSQPWAEKTGTLPSRLISSIAIHGNTILVSVSGLSGAASSASVFRSTDAGDTWGDVSGDLPGVVGNGVVFDPTAPDNTWYLATDTGVFRTTTGGTSWDAFDNGIPNVVCSGLVVDSKLKMLFCSTFGRGAYKVDITPGVVKPEVDLYVRDDNLDTGELFPSPSGVPDPLLPSPGTANFWMSPDIKVNHAPVFTPPGSVFDGVDFDTAVEHQDPFRGQSNRFYVQLHNRGWTSTTNVWVRAFIADASAALPNLPNALVPPQFNVTSGGPWTPVGPAQHIPELIPNRPGVLFWDFVIPSGEATHSCCLLVVSSDENTFNDSATDISSLIRYNKQVALKNLHVVDPGPSPMGPTMQAIDFHNPGDKPALVGIVLRPSGFGAGRIGLLLPQVTFSDRCGQSRGVVAVPLACDDPVGEWYVRGADKRTRERLRARFLRCDRSRIFEFEPNLVSLLQGIELGAGQTLRAILVSTLKNNVYLTGPSRLEITQLVDGRVVGGATFQYGYDLPPPGTMPLCRRIRITADALEWCPCTHEPCHHIHGAKPVLLSRVTISNGSERVSERLLLSSDRHEDDQQEDDQQEDDQQEDDHHRHCRHCRHGHTIKGAILFDGVVREGESLTLAILAVHVEHATTNVLFRREFEGSTGISSWLGEHEDRGTGRFKLEYGIDEIGDNGQGGGETD